MPTVSSRMMMTSDEEERFSDVQARMELFGDVETGSPTPPRKVDSATWRSRRLHTYDAEGHYDGDGAAHANHLFHKDYRHYKFYGYGGKGAKTSWAHNPKHTYLGLQDDPRRQLYAGHLGSTLFQESGHIDRQDKPFRKHSSARISVIRESSSSPTSSRYARKGSPGYIGASMDLSGASPKLSLEESQIVNVDLSRLAIERTTRATSSEGPVVKVVTYPTMLEGDSLMQSARSTGSGQPKFCRTQAPFHQRYNHYKYYGYAGHGARTSWASGGGVGPNQP